MVAVAANKGSQDLSSTSAKTWKVYLIDQYDDEDYDDEDQDVRRMIIRVDSVVVDDDDEDDDDDDEEDDDDG